MTINYHSVTMSELRAPRTNNTCRPVCTEAYKANARAYEKKFRESLQESFGESFGKVLDQIKKERA